MFRELILLAEVCEKMAYTGITSRGWDEGIVFGACSAARDALRTAAYHGCEIDSEFGRGLTEEEVKEVVEKVKEIAYGNKIKKGE